MAKTIGYEATFVKRTTEYDEDTFVTKSISKDWVEHPKVGVVVGIRDITNMVTNGYTVRLLPPKKEKV